MHHIVQDSELQEVAGEAKDALWAGAICFAGLGRRCVLFVDEAEHPQAGAADADYV